MAASTNPVAARAKVQDRPVFLGDQSRDLLLEPILAVSLTMANGDQ